MGFTTVPDKASGATFTEAMWDTYIKDNLNFLANRPMARVYLNSTQTVANTTNHAVQWDAEEKDTDSMVDLGTNATRITATTGGWYLVTFGLVFASDTTGVQRVGYIRPDGSAYQYARADSDPDLSYPSINGCCLMPMNASSYIELIAYQDSGGNLDLQGTATSVYSFLTAHWVGTG